MVQNTIVLVLGRQVSASPRKPATHSFGSRRQFWRATRIRASAGLQHSSVACGLRQRRGWGRAVPRKKLVTRRDAQFESCLDPRAGRIWALGGEATAGVKANVTNLGGPACEPYREFGGQESCCLSVSDSSGTFTLNFLVNSSVRALPFSRSPFSKALKALAFSLFSGVKA